MRLTRLLSGFVFFVAMAVTSVQAQTESPARINWGPISPEPNNTMATKVVGLTPDGYYLLRQKVLQSPSVRPRAWVEFATKDLKVTRSEELDLKYKGKQRDFEDLIYYNGQLYLLTSFNNTAHKKNYLFLQKVSTRGLTASKSLKMIAETEARNKEVEGSFAVDISKDSTHLLVYHDLPFEKNNPARFGFHVFDQNFDLVWEKEVILPYPDNQFTVEEYRVDDQGNVFLLGVLYTDEAKFRRRGNPTYRYVLLSYLNKGETEDEIQIDLPNKFITDLTFRVGNDGNLVFAGFYSDKGSYSIKGSYFFHLNPYDRSILNRKHTPFDFEFLTAFMRQKEKVRALQAEQNNDPRRSPELYNYSLDRLILRSDGGAVLVAEQFYIERETYYRDYYPTYGYYPYGYYNSYYRNSRDIDYLYNYNDIIVVNIRPDGDLQWTARIPKWQETRNDGGYYSSYAMSIVRDKLYFLFNDDARNFDPKRKGDRIYKYTGSNEMMVLAEMNLQGDVQTYPVISGDGGVTLRPKMCKQTGLRELLLFGEAKRGFRLGKMIFN
ncbi:MAG: hypothetical protein CMN32_01470 [Saprospirales bacterium]|nr:hypothetical protein [Saprospirales bacterium]